MTPSETYKQNGFASPVSLIGAQEAADHRGKFEAVEAEHGSQHYKSKMHTLLDFAADLATHPKVINTVEQLLGPDILLFDVINIVKEPHFASHVSWHQDLEYWGLANDKQVSMWLALTPATEVSVCMRMVPGSHKNGRMKHDDTNDECKVVFRGQSVSGVAEEQAVMCPLQGGRRSTTFGPFTPQCPTVPTSAASASMYNMSTRRRGRPCMTSTQRRLCAARTGLITTKRMCLRMG